MQSNIAEQQKKVRLLKLEAALEQFELDKLKLLQKVANIDKEIVIQREAINKVKGE